MQSKVAIRTLGLAVGLLGGNAQSIGGGNQFDPPPPSTTDSMESTLIEHSGSIRSDIHALPTAGQSYINPEPNSSDATPPFTLTGDPGIQVTTADTVPASSVKGIGSNSTTSTAAPPASDTATSSSATASSSITADSSNNSSGGGLSTGAKAGIAVGVVVGVLALLGLAFFLFRRSQKSKRARVRSGSTNGGGIPTWAAPNGVGMAMGDNTSTSLTAHPGRHDTGDIAAEKARMVGVGVNAASSSLITNDAATPERGVESHEMDRFSSDEEGLAAVPGMRLRGHSDRDEHLRDDVSFDLPVDTDGGDGGRSPNGYRNLRLGADTPGRYVGVDRLAEPGMSEDELARLEDEERRIDEAIAAADRERNRS